MPRHPPNALTSRLRVHTTNDKADHPATALALGSQVRLGLDAADKSTQHSNQFATASNLFKEEDRATTASISRTHLQCQRWGQIPRIRGWAAKGLSSFLEQFSPSHIPADEYGGAYRDRTDDLKLAKLALSQLS